MTFETSSGTTLTQRFSFGKRIAITLLAEALAVGIAWSSIVVLHTSLVPALGAGILVACFGIALALGES